MMQAFYNWWLFYSSRICWSWNNVPN
jgi:hypothetical protein